VCRFRRAVKTVKSVVALLCSPLVFTGGSTEEASHPSWQSEMDRNVWTTDSSDSTDRSRATGRETLGVDFRSRRMPH
jgi:hypothetical protein